MLAFLSLLFVFYSYLYSFVSYCCPFPTCCLFYLAFTPVFVDRIILFVIPFILKRMASSLPEAIVFDSMTVAARPFSIVWSKLHREPHSKRATNSWFCLSFAAFLPTPIVIPLTFRRVRLFEYLIKLAP